MKKNKEKRGYTKKLVTAALFSAICFGMTMVSVPLPVVGYGNLGDCFVLLAGWLLGPIWGALAASLGTALADVALGYAVYAPATFVIKGLMVLVSYCIGVLLSGHSDGRVRQVVAHASSAVWGELIMIGGYFAYETLLYGMAAAAGALVGNSVQAAVGVVLSTALITVIRNNKALDEMFTKDR